MSYWLCVSCGYYHNAETPKGECPHCGSLPEGISMLALEMELEMESITVFRGGHMPKVEQAIPIPKDNRLWEFASARSAFDFR